MATFLARALGLIEVPVPSASGYTDISIDSRFTCALRLGGTVECWGRLNYEGESEPSQDVEISAPDGRYKDLDHGSRSGCDLHALRQDGAIECWTLKEVESDWDLGAGPPWVRPAELVVAENSDVPPGSFVSVDGGLRNPRRRHHHMLGQPREQSTTRPAPRWNLHFGSCRPLWRMRNPRRRHHRMLAQRVQLVHSKRAEQSLGHHRHRPQHVWRPRSRCRPRRHRLLVGAPFATLLRLGLQRAASPRRTGMSAS